jgi:hypothetical protein
MGAVVARVDESVLADAVDKGSGSAGLPLDGEFMTVNDWIDVTGMPCEGE